MSVLVSADDYKALSQMLEKARVSRPGFSFGDLLRGFIREGITAGGGKLSKLPPMQDRIRRLHAISQSARDLAHELGRKKKNLLT